MVDAADFVFWPACVRLRPFREHVEAAVAGGFTSLVVSTDTIDEAIQSGLSLAEMKRIAEDAGVPIRHYDSLTAWAPIRLPSWAPERMRARFDVPMTRALDICDALRVTNIVAVAAFPRDTLDQGQLIEGFADLCDRVEKAGIRVELEFMPILGVPDLVTAWDIVRGSARRNSGLMLDTWHFVKSGSSIELLRSIPGEYLESIQLSDGYAKLRGKELFEDMIQWREFPGDGELPVLDLFRIASSIGKLRHVGPEVFSKRADGMAAREAGVRSGAAMRALLAQAGEGTAVRSE
jgi:sugar phosphate isomerase/epimerase